MLGEEGGDVSGGEVGVPVVLLGEGVGEDVDRFEVGLTLEGGKGGL